MSAPRLPLPRSVAGRLAVASLAVLPLFLGGTGHLLQRAFGDSLLAGEARRLRLHSYLLLGEMDIEGNRPRLPAAFQEPLLNQLDSGLYAFVLDREGRELWRSASALLQPAPAGPVTAPEAGSTRFAYAADAGLLTFYHPVLWERAEGGDLPLTVLLTHSDRELRAALGAYRRTLWQGLGALGGLLVLAQILVLRWGLRPLRRLARDIADLESDPSRRLGEDYPREVLPLTGSLNLLLDSEHRQRERYRDTMADLAHSLKTPLAILRGLEDAGRLPADAGEPLARMGGIIDHQLQRATRGVQHQLTTARPVAPVVERLLASLDKVYWQAPRAVRTRGDAEASFRGDERDLLEVLGNVLDNAYKYSASRIRVDYRHGAGGLEIEVQDDGPGIEPGLARRLTRRGERGDEAAPGQGIGLAVTADILAAYGGQLSLGTSQALGGARVTLSFPVADGPRSAR